jgi:hypothetical protein
MLIKIMVKQTMTHSFYRGQFIAKNKSKRGGITIVVQSVDLRTTRIASNPHSETS